MVGCWYKTHSYVCNYKEKENVFKGEFENTSDLMRLLSSLSLFLFLFGVWLGVGWGNYTVRTSY